MITEPNALNTLIAPPTLTGKMANFVTGKSSVGETLGEGAMSVIPWRRANVNHVNNEIYFDIVEEIDCIVESNGQVVANDVRGIITCASSMSGVPDLTLIFSNPTIIEDCSFHPCVRYARFDREQVVSFVPPDGVFQLMTYRVVDRNPQAPIYCRPELRYREGTGRLSFTIGPKPMAARKGVTMKTSSGGMGSAPVSGSSDVVVEDVRLVVTFPKCIKTIDLSSEVGIITTDPRTNELTWNIGRLPSGKTPELVGNLYLPVGVVQPLEAVSAVLHFTVPGQTVSGLSVKDLLLVNEKYKFVKGIKTILKTGRYQVRV